MLGRMTRRRAIGTVAGALWPIPGLRRAGAESPAAACYWRFVESRCNNGTLRERWCYRCCDPYGCEDVLCEWRAAGAC